MIYNIFEGTKIVGKVECDDTLEGIKEAEAVADMQYPNWTAIETATDSIKMRRY
jgi:hypothetical protein